MADTDSTHVVRPELHRRVPVERDLATLPHVGLVTPRGHEQPKDGQRWAPDTILTLQQHVVLLLGGSRSHACDGVGARRSEEVVGVDLIRARLGGDSHRCSSTFSKSGSRSVVGSPWVAVVHAATISAAVRSKTVTAAVIASCQRWSRCTRLVHMGRPPQKLM